MTARPGRMLKPKFYRPDEGDVFVRLREISPEHVGRVFEARNQKTAEGILGRLADAEHHLLLGTVAIRFEGERLGMFDVPDAQILLKADTFDLDAFRAALEGSEPSA